MTGRAALLLALGLAPGCRAVFGMLDPTLASTGVDAMGDVPVAPLDVAHVDDASLVGSTDDLLWPGLVTIDTRTLTAVPPLPSTTPFHVMTQPGGPDVAVLEVGSLHAIDIVHVTGTRPLIIVASGDLRFDALLEAWAVGSGVAPGARPTGTGVGTAGLHAGQYEDGGGGGGGFGTAGGNGATAIGTSTATGGPGGSAYGDLAIVLEGGAAGAVGTTMCGGMPAGGGGGGAIQLSTSGTIEIDAAISVGGGGGDGGVVCYPGPMIGSGAGGGAGGAIYLQASTLTGTGTLAANGGGGGSGGNYTGTVTPGSAGQNGGITTTAAVGGAQALTEGGAGGRGGALTPAAAAPDHTAMYPNGGGGGGAAGRIFLDIPPGAGVPLTSSPLVQRR